MKEGIQLAEIIPAVSYLDFIGTTNDIDTIEESQSLKGHVRLVLIKAVKIRSITIKFKGTSIVKTFDYNNEVTTPLLPKLKTKALQKSTMLSLGEHFLPWELEVPNIYPRSFHSQRGRVDYKVQMKISLGGMNKSIIINRNIVIRRHMLLSRDLTALITTKTLDNIVNQMLRYRIETPKVVCTEQGYIPISIEFMSLNKMLPVKQIYTQIIETTTYRCRNVSKTEANMTIVAIKKNSPIIESFNKYGDAGLFSKTVKRVKPATINNLDIENQDYNSSSMPLLVKQDLDMSLEHDIDSPLVAISHHVELTFNFGGVVGQEDEIRAKIPVIVSSVPDSTTTNSKTLSLKKYTIETQLHTLPISIEIADAIPTIKRNDGYRTTLDESTISTIKDNLLISTDGKTLKKAASDQNISRTRTDSEKSLLRDYNSKRRSITPSPPSSRPTSIVSKKLPIKSIDIDLANNNKSTTTHYMYTPTSATFSPSTTLDDDDRAGLKSPFGGTFMGLHPPPRKNTRKKEQPKTADNNKLSRKLTTSSSTSTSSTTTTTTTTSSRPTSPISIIQAPPITATGIIDPYTMPLPPIPHNNNYPENCHLLSPTTTARRAFLNQSKSSNTSSTFKTPIKKRSNSINQENIYSSSITNHYVGAELPPIPSTGISPAITRQRLPSVPLADRDEHRKTRMYFEEEESDDEDFLFL